MHFASSSVTRRISFAVLICTSAVLIKAEPNLATVEPSTEIPWVTVGAGGKITCRATPRGDRIPDFSFAGYEGGGAPLPHVPQRQTVSPSGADDTAAIQKALDSVASVPLVEGFRGAVVLQPGVFHCEQPLKLNADGVVLGGSGSGPNGSTIEMTGAPHLCVSIAGEESRAKHSNSTGVAITDRYVPCGAQRVTVASTDGLAPGDVVHIIRPVTESWLHFMGMDQLVRNGKPQTWIKAGSQIFTERIIHSIEGHQVTFDMPLTDALDATYLQPSGATMVKVATSHHLSHCGVEALSINSPPPAGDLTTANNHAVTFDHCQDCWLRDIAMRDTLNNVTVLSGARRITLEEVHAVHSATIAKGKGYPADFLIVGSQVLMHRCTSSGDGSFYVATLSASATLNVALHCQFQGKGSIQPHMRWSTALLIDSCQLPEGRIEYVNRKFYGTGHGWAMGWGVVWNSQAAELSIEQPPGAVNWCIGCQGALGKKATAEHFASYGTPVTPASLYLAQLRERLGDEALRNIGE